MDNALLILQYHHNFYAIKNPLKWVCTCMGSFVICGESGPLMQVNLGAVAEAAKLLVLWIYIQN